MAFTPAPWAVDVQANAIAITSPLAEGNGRGGKRIATVAQPPYSSRAPIGLANAHLIAAAPDLLEAAKVVRRRCNTHAAAARAGAQRALSGERDTYIVFAEMFEALAEELHPAILKAEGLQSPEGGDRG